MIPIITKNQPFPPIEKALSRPNGLLASGADLSTNRLLSAYRLGIFPWYSEEEPILWWSPDPRLVLEPNKIKISRSLRKSIKKRPIKVTADLAFEKVIQSCQLGRDSRTDTWITQNMKEAYTELHKKGHAHSIEVWEKEKLIGGLYGVAIGKAFFGESMFHFQTDASKIALVTLALQLQRWDFGIIDCQVSSNHLKTMGAKEMSRQKFALKLKELVKYTQAGQWILDNGLI